MLPAHDKPSQLDACPVCLPLVEAVPDLITSSDDEWNLMPQTASSRSCGNAYGYRVMGTGTVTSYGPVFCRTYGHRDCAENIVHAAFTQFLMAFGHFDKIYYLPILTKDFDSDRLSRRAYDKKRAGSDLARLRLWIRREDGITHLFCAENLGGTEAPQNLVPIDVRRALEVLSVALRLPGIERIQWTGATKSNDALDDEPQLPVGGGESVALGVMSRETFEKVVRRATQVGINRGYNVEHLDGSLVRVPGGVPPATWQELLSEAASLHTA